VATTEAPEKMSQQTLWIKSVTMLATSVAMMNHQMKRAKINNLEVEVLF
jgi:hypothetical protein